MQCSNLHHGALEVCLVRTRAPDLGSCSFQDHLLEALLENLPLADLSMFGRSPIRSISVPFLCLFRTLPNPAQIRGTC